MDRGQYGPIPVKAVLEVTELAQVEQVCLLGIWAFAFVLSWMFLEKLMALCVQLEQQLSQVDQQRRRLLEAVLAEALGGRLPTEQEENHAAIA